MKAGLQITLLFILLTACVFAQDQVIGSFPTMQGGFENISASNRSNTTVVNGEQITSYTGATENNSTPSINSTIYRSGNKSLSWVTSSTSALLFSPTADNLAIKNNTSYVIQFYWWKEYSSSARSFKIKISSDGTLAFGPQVNTDTLGSSSKSTSWTKCVVICTTGSSQNSIRYGLVQFQPKGGSFSTQPGYLIDDFVVYEGTSVDNTPPDPPQAVLAKPISNTEIQLDWVAPESGVDGGGYMVVRGTADPVTPPNQNGIYGVGNQVAAGEVVVYVGTNTSFTDTGLDENTTYYYRVYTVDKAFNYSTSVAANTTLPVELTSFVATQSGRGALLQWRTATEVNSAYFEVYRRSAGSEQRTLVGKVQAAGTSNSPKEYTYTDHNVGSGRYVYELKQVDIDGTSEMVGSVEVEILAPKELTLGNYPNPFNPRTVIEFTVPEDGYAVVKVYNVVGQEVATLYNGTAKAGEYYRVTFGGNQLSSGLYYTVLETNGQRVVKKMVLMK